MPKSGTEYRTLNTEIRKKCRSAKDDWPNENARKS